MSSTSHWPRSAWWPGSSEVCGLTPSSASTWVQVSQLSPWVPRQTFFALQASKHQPKFKLGRFIKRGSLDDKSKWNRRTQPAEIYSTPVIGGKELA